MNEPTEPVRGVQINLSEIKTPQDPKFIEWRKTKYEEFVRQNGSKETDYDSIDIHAINGYRFLKGMLKYLETNKAEWSLITDTIEKLAATKRKIAEQADSRSSNANDIAAREQIVGKTIDEVFDGKEINWEMASRFDAHGIVKGGLDKLLPLLDGGIDPKRPFSSTNLMKEGGENLGGGKHGPYTDGGFIVLGRPGKNLVEDGIHMVIINWQYKEASLALAKKYPKIIFATPDGIDTAMKYLLSNAQ